MTYETINWKEFRDLSTGNLNLKAALRKLVPANIDVSEGYQFIDAVVDLKPIQSRQVAAMVVTTAATKVYDSLKQREEKLESMTETFSENEHKYLKSISDLQSIKAFNKNDGYLYDIYSIEFLAGGIKVEGTGIHIGNGWATCNEGYDHPCDVVLCQYSAENDEHHIFGQDGFKFNLNKDIMKTRLRSKDATVLSYDADTDSELSRQGYQLVGSVIRDKVKANLWLRPGLDWSAPEGVPAHDESS